MMKKTAENRVPGIRFCPEVPHKVCVKCKYAPYGHPLLRSKDSDKDTEVYNKLCIVDCLGKKVPLRYEKEEMSYYLLFGEFQPEVSKSQC